MIVFGGFREGHTGGDRDLPPQINLWIGNNHQRPLALQEEDTWIMMYFNTYELVVLKIYGTAV